MLDLDIVLKIVSFISGILSILKMLGSINPKKRLICGSVLVFSVFCLLCVKIYKVDEKCKASNNRYYRVISENANWYEAKKACEKTGGHLVTITNEEEQMIVSNLIRDVDYCWIGAERKDKKGSWKWITDEQFIYVNWDNGEPNNYKTSEQLDGHENGVQILQNGKWNDSLKLKDIHNEQPIHYICEWENQYNIIIFNKNLKDYLWDKSKMEKLTLF